MRIIVDADANPTNKICLSIAKEYVIDIIFVYDNTHHFDFDYGQMIVCDKGSDAVDFKILSLLKENDILVTQDFELAGFAFNKKAYALNPKGLIYTSDNIDSLLQQRYLSAKARKSGYRSKIKKRSKEDDDLFQASLLQLIKKVGDYND